jgi:soluble lytic murein transglycosylase-like protein
MKWRLRLLYDLPSDFNGLSAYRPVLGAFVIVSTFLLTPTATAYAADATRLIAAEARRQGVPVAFALRVAEVESGVQCHRHNKSGASGPLQLMPATARALGFRGHIRKASCQVQVHWGMRHLAMCYRGAHGNQRVAAACHYQGVSALRRVSKAGAAYARKVAK